MYIYFFFIDVFDIFIYYFIRVSLTLSVKIFIYEKSNLFFGWKLNELLFFFSCEI